MTPHARLRLAGTALLLAAATLLTAERFHEKTDPFYPVKITYSDPLVLGHAKLDDGSGAYAAIVLERLDEENAGTRYDMKVMCGPSRRKQMDVGAGGSLTLSTDSDKKVSYFSRYGSAGSKPAPGTKNPEPPHVLYEEVPAEDLHDFAKAKSIRVRIAGISQSIDADFTSGNLKVLREFVKTYVPPPAAQ